MANRISSSRELEKIYLENNISHSPCKECSSAIWYPHTIVSRDKKGNVKIVNANHLTIKNFNGKDYPLVVCYDCLTLKFPEISNKNSSKLFNTCNEYVKFAFKVEDDEFLSKRKDHGITLDKMIQLHGEREGTQKWEKYCSFQREKNTFEYKKQKYDLTREEFDEFNRSRGVTEANLIKKYGTDIGKAKWLDYINRQRFTKSIEYYIDKYGKKEGPLKWSELNSSKALTLSNFVKRYGEELGSNKFEEYLSRFKTSTSKVSQSFFNSLDLKLGEFNLKTYYHSKNTEFSILLKNLNKYYKLDYYIFDLKIAIEYNGDYWHANPEIYLRDDIIHSDLTANEIWDRDTARINNLLLEKGIETIKVWQKDDFINRENILNKIYEEIKHRVRENKIN